MQKFKFSVDSTFQIGSYHVNAVSPCQDYALDHATEEFALLVVSDGCSSGGKTDFGSRFMAHRYLAEAIKVAAKGKDPGNISVDVTVRDLEFFGLRTSYFLATLLTVSATQEEVVINLVGDGVIVLESPTERKIYQYEWENNTPAYPVYHSQCGMTYELDISFELAQSKLEFPFTCKTWEFTEKQLTNWEIHEHLLKEVLPKGIQIRIPMEEVLEKKWNKIAIFSDGVSQIRSFVEQSGKALSLTEVVDRCLDFKNTTGVFVKRRIRKQINDWRKQGFEPTDDLSCAVLLIEPEFPEEVE